MKVSLYCVCVLSVNITYLLSYFFLKLLCKLVSLKNGIETLECQVYSKLLKEIFRDKRGFLLDIKMIHRAPSPKWPKTKHLTLRRFLRQPTSWWTHSPTKLMQTEAQSKAIISEPWKLTQSHGLKSKSSVHEKLLMNLGKTVRSVTFQQRLLVIAPSPQAQWPAEIDKSAL